MRRSGIIAAATLCAASLAMGCSTEGDGAGDETFEPPNGEVEFRGTTSSSALSAEEWETYKADRQYVSELAGERARVNINHADPRQHRFATLRLKLAGKTPETSPLLFKLMDDLRVAHAAQGLAAGDAGPPTVHDDVPSGHQAPGGVEVPAEVPADLPHAEQEGPKSQHAVWTISTDKEAQKATAHVMASRKDKLAHAFVDVALWNEKKEPIGEAAFLEVFEQMRFRIVSAKGDPRLAEKFMFADSFLSEKPVAGELNQSYVVGATSSLSSLVTLLVPTVEHPADSDGDGFATVCLDRTWTGDCEYDNTGMDSLRMPLKGSISVTGTGAYIDWATILTTYKSATGPWPGRIYATLGTSGGGCTLPPGGANMSMQTFWQQVTFDISEPTKINWDLFTDPNIWADFSPACRLVQDVVYITIELEIPYFDSTTGMTGTLPVTITNAPTTPPLLPPNLQFSPPVKVTNSCLAAGTLVAVEGGAARKIEELQIGDKIANPYASSLTITDTAVGIERSQMVRIMDSRGRELLMTETHPLYVMDRGMVAAKHLQVGDRVKTDDGPKLLLRVTREDYSGKVFNLKVGTTEEASALGVDQTAVYANGFLVGDGQIQDRHEVLELKGRGDGAKRLSARWRKDYLSSRSRAAD